VPSWLSCRVPQAAEYGSGLAALGLIPIASRQVTTLAQRIRPVVIAERRRATRFIATFSRRLRGAVGAGTAWRTEAPMAESTSTTQSGDRLTPAQVARAFHEAYEILAPHFGYSTRLDTRVEWDELPESNRDLMIATIRNVLIERFRLLPLAVAAHQWAQAWDATHGNAFTVGDAEGERKFAAREVAEHTLRAAIREVPE
jgi:hypothetical protein